MFRCFGVSVFRCFRFRGTRRDLDILDGPKAWPHQDWQKKKSERMSELGAGLTGTGLTCSQPLEGSGVGGVCAEGRGGGWGQHGTVCLGLGRSRVGGWTWAGWSLWEEFRCFSSPDPLFVFVFDDVCGFSKNCGGVWRFHQ